MLNTSTLKEKVTVSAKAWLVSFQETPEPLHPGSGSVDSSSIAINEPRSLIASLTEKDVEQLLSACVSCRKAQAAAFSSAAGNPESLTIVWMPPGVNTPSSIEQDAEAWVRCSTGTPKSGSIRAGISTVRVIWNHDRALIYTGPEQLQSAIDAVARFGVVQNDALKLEREMNLTWSAIGADAALTHSITPRDQRHQASVFKMSELATRMRVSYLRVTKALEQLNPALDQLSKRIYAELILAANLYDRMEVLEDPTQLASDYYELASSRSIEVKNARSERRHAIIGAGLELVIILVLLLTQPFIFGMKLSSLTDEFSFKGGSTASSEEASPKASPARQKDAEINPPPSARRAGPAAAGRASVASEDDNPLNSHSAEGAGAARSASHRGAVITVPSNRPLPWTISPQDQ